MKKIITTFNRNKINHNRINYGISFFCFLAILLFAVGCNSLSRCEPCTPVEDNSAWSAPSAKLNLLSNIYGKKSQNPKTTQTNSNAEKYNKKSKSNPTSYLTIPPPPESPE
ncbi:MAG: hypothetical protein LBT09_13055 [Planctomycetaceae bacterium]|nr:hypothetical protein [Planctomycetaceae bacterium]